MSNFIVSHILHMPAEGIITFYDYALRYVAPLFHQDLIPFFKIQMSSSVGTVLRFAHYSIF